VGHNENPGRTYTITFPGDVPQGFVRGQVTKGSVFGVGEIPGPCAGPRISGFVFVDSDSNGVKGTSEAGIADVTVALVDGFGNTDTLRTDASGAYLFIVRSGTYTVRIDAETPSLDFNEDLFLQFDAKSPTSLIVSVPPDSPGNNFAFAPRIKKLIDDLDAGTLLTTGLPVKYWKAQLKSAISGKGRADYDAAEMLAFIDAIEGLALSTPYQFTDGNEFREAFDILNDTSRDEVAKLRRELLATEFNHVSGKGLVSELDLQLVLIGWGEGLLAGVLPAGDITPMILRTPIEDAGTLFDKLNGATSGGGTN